MDSKSKKRNSLFALLKWGFLFGLSLGILDILFQGNYHEADGKSVFHLLTSLYATSLISFFLFIIFLAIPSSILLKGFKSKSSWYLITGSIFSTLLFAIMSAGALFKSGLSSPEIIQICIAIGICLSVSILAFLVIRRWGEDEKHILQLKAFAAGVPLALFCWIFVDILTSGSLKELVAKFSGTGVVAAVLIVFLFSFLLLYLPVRLIGFQFLKRCTVALAILGVSVTIALVFHQGASQGMQQQNESDLSVEAVILLTVDTLRMDALSAYGSTEVHTKNLDELLKDSIQYNTAFASSSWTLPSFASMFTGFAPQTHQVLKPASKMDDAFQTLPEYLKQAGYTTAAVGYNPFLTYTNFDQGFDWFDVSPNTIWGSTFGGKVLRRIFPDPGTVEITNRAIQIAENLKGGPFFLWVHYFDPHLPYAPPESYLPSAKSAGRIGKEFDSGKEVQRGELVLTETEKQRVKELYLSEVQFVDDQIGRLLNSLRKLGIYEKSLILFTSDHGEEFWEHDGFEHGHTLYNEVVQVPLGIKLPGKTVGARVNEAVSLQAVAPTILQICRIGESVDFPEQWPSPLAKKVEEAPVFLAGTLYGDPKEAVCFKERKLIRNQMSRSLDLFDLADLPLSSVSGSDRSTLLEEGRELLDKLSQSSPIVREKIGLTGGEKVSMDQGTLDSLRALGYVQ